MSKKRKVWSIVLMVVGGLSVIGSIGNLKEYWFSLIIGLGLIAGGIILFVTGKKKAEAQAAAEAEQMRLAEEKKKADLEKRKAMEEAAFAGQEARKRRLVFNATYIEKFQDKIKKLYQKELNDFDENPPYYEIKPYKSYDGSTRYNILVDDDKIGEVPARYFDELGKVFDIRPRVIDIRYIKSQKESGTWFDVEVCYTYWIPEA